MNERDEGEPRDVGVEIVYGEAGTDAWDNDRSGTIRIEVGGGPAWVCGGDAARNGEEPRGGEKPRGGLAANRGGVDGVLGRGSGDRACLALKGGGVGEPN